MALSTQLSHSASNAAVNAITALVASGSIVVAAGTQTTSAAPSGTNILATFTLGASPFASASGGSASLNSLGAVTASNTGTATYAAFLNSSGTVIWTCSIAAGSGGNINLNSTSISSGASVQITSYTFSANEANAS